MASEQRVERRGEREERRGEPFIALNFKSAYLPGGIGTDPIAIPRLPACTHSVPCIFLLLFFSPSPLYFLPRSRSICTILALHRPRLGDERNWVVLSYRTQPTCISVCVCVCVGLSNRGREEERRKKSRCRE